MGFTSRGRYVHEVYRHNEFCGKKVLFPTSFLPQINTADHDPNDSHRHTQFQRTPISRVNFSLSFSPIPVPAPKSSSQIIVPPTIPSPSSQMNILAFASFCSIATMVSPGGYNAALKQVDADYYVLLNSDVEVGPGWMEPILRLMEKDPAIGACQPKIRMYADRESFEYAGAAGGWLDHLGYPFARGRIFDVCEKDMGQYDKTEPVFWASGAALFIRAAALSSSWAVWTAFFSRTRKRSISAGGCSWPVIRSIAVPNRSSIISEAGHSPRAMKERSFSISGIT